ncbi:MAG: LacI family DNA-binding transcriptional regulator [Ktedonobacteraceae bacterium]|nr:LacI family DNA-binding transcriptional regulator [Ktedonobacteraceae bacterium]MBO0792557.1 LacI family DNA-binding transcriptional regulator [Ktedonobacteraceae bacterium]
MPTIRDVAAFAQVSISTVSHVINNTRSVDSAKVERVREAIRVLGYQPNSVARSLRHGKTSMLALIVPDNSNPYFAELARSIEDVGFAEDLGVVLCNSDGSPTKEEQYIRSLLGRQIDGYIFISTTNQVDHLRLLIDANMPLVVVDRRLDDLQVDQVFADNEQGGYLAGQYLIQQGHRQIACIAGPDDIALSADRLNGFRRALTEAQIDLPAEAIVRGDFRATGGQLAVKELLARDLPLTAIFATNDLMAIGAIRALRLAHIRVPEDISVIGFDNTMLSSLITPTLTTITQPIKEIARQSMTLLLRRLKHKAAEHTQVILPTTLVERESCCAISQASSPA